MKALLACVAIVLALSACGGGNSTIPHVGGGTPSHRTVAVKFKVSVPNARGTRRHHGHLSARLKRIWAVADNTAGIKVVQYATGDRTTPLGTALANISATSSSCTPIVSSGSFGGRTCTFSLQAVPGTDDFVATTYDRVPSGGAIPAGANQLGYGVAASQTITAGTSPSVSLTIDGVLAKLQLSVTPSSLHTLIPSTATLNVVGLDADNDVIVSNAFIDGSGNTVSTALSLNNALPLAGSSTASLALASATVTAPQPAGIALAYAPTTNGIVNASNQTVTISASPSASTVTTTAATLTAVAPSPFPITDTNLNSAITWHGGIAFDTNSGSSSAGFTNVYYTSPGGTGGGSIDECTKCTTSPTQPVPNASAPPASPVYGSLAGSGTPLYGSSQIFAILGTTFNTVSNTPLVTNTFASAPPLAPNGSGMAYDSSRSAVWYTSGSSLEEYPTSGNGPVAALSPALSSTTTGGIAIDATTHPNAWLIDDVGNTLIECVTTPSPACNAPIAMSAGRAPFDIVDTVNAGGTESLLVTDRGTAPAILQYNTSGTLLNALALPAGAKPYYLWPDNAQPGVVWFDYLSGTSIGVGRIDTNPSTPAFLMATGPSVSGGAAGAIGVAPTGDVYTVFDNASELVHWSP